MSSWSPASSGWSSYIPSKRGVVEGMSSLGGAASTVYGAVSNSVPSGQGYLSSLPAGLKRLSDYLPSGETGEHGTGDRDDVVTVTFDMDTGPRKYLHFLNVCFSNGFQIWEVLDSDEQGSQATRETQPLREVVSVRQGYTHIVKVLSTVPVAEDSPLHAKQPAVAVVAGDEPGDSNVVRLFSLPDNDYVHQIRFHGAVHAVTCNRHWMIVCLKNQLVLHRMHDMTCVQTLSTYPSPTPQGVVALGPRWLAYASNQPLRTAPEDASNVTDPYNTYGSAYLDLGVAAASTAASGAAALGGLGLRTLNSYLGSSPPIAQAQEQPQEYAGQVMVRDLESQSVVHHFKAQEGPVSIIRFDPSGLLLATAAVDGHNINVFQVDTSHLHAKTKSSVPRAPKHLYKLVRGMTSAIVDDLTFSPDARWISVTTRSRTAHLYAINGDGSHATVETHVPSASIDAAWPMYPSSASYAATTNTPVTLFAVQRIKQQEHLPARLISRTLSANGSKGASIGALASSCTRFAIPGNTSAFSQCPAAASGMFMVTGEGVGVVLATYQLSPLGKEDPDTLAQTIHLDVDCTGTMDICRRRSWRAQECNEQRLLTWTKTAEENSNPEEDSVLPDWASNVEIYTHERGDDAVWGSKHFSFHSFKKGDVPPAHGPTEFLEKVATVAVGGRGVETDGIDPDAEEYFFVQGPGPRTRQAVPNASPYQWPACPPPPRPDALRLQPDSSPGVYGGLPSSFGSSQGTPPAHELRMHLQGNEPSGGLAGSCGSGKYAQFGCRGIDDDAVASVKGLKISADDFPAEEGVFEMDVTLDSPAANKASAGWDSDNEREDGCTMAVAKNEMDNDGPGMAFSALLFEDHDPIGKGRFHSRKTASTSNKGAKNPIESLSRSGRETGVSVELEEWEREADPEKVEDRYNGWGAGNRDDSELCPASGVAAAPEDDWDSWGDPGSDLVASPKGLKSPKISKKSLWEEADDLEEAEAVAASAAKTALIQEMPVKEDEDEDERESEKPTPGADSLHSGLETRNIGGSLVSAGGASTKKKKKKKK